MDTNVISGVNFRTLNGTPPFNILEDNIERLNYIYAALSRLYPERFEMNVFPNKFDESGKIPVNLSWFYVTLYFPKIEIRNREKENHTIEDIFVRFTIKQLKGEGKQKDKLTISGVRGTRTSFTKAEIFSGYTHSHLSPTPSQCVGNWQSLTTSNPGESLADLERNIEKNRMEKYFGGFCLGTGGISKLITIMNGDEKLQDDIGQWILLLRSFKSYLEYESLEGGPYRKIHDIHHGAFESNIQFREEDQFVNIHGGFANLIANRENNIRSVVSTLIKDGSIKVFINDKGKIEILYNPDICRLLCMFLKDMKDSIYVRATRADGGFVYGRPGSSSIDTKYMTEERIAEVEKRSFPFRGKRIHLRLIDKESNKVVKDSAKVNVIHPVITKFILNDYAAKCNRKKDCLSIRSNKYKAKASDF